MRQKSFRSIDKVGDLHSITLCPFKKKKNIIPSIEKEGKAQSRRRSRECLYKKKMMEEEEKNKSKWRRSCLILYTSNSNLNEISFIFFEIFVFYHRSNYSKFFGAVINIF